ncbi:probable galacturonosyltransferase 4 [Phragmites australis]|uniref:probable galacturonosyltransferase 4 n=1 Tax=Phragmites australis TaxID=29695 RepID=UPI002D780ACD|nr:probable galacturonosyltransferase 4 [Phragmites australis]
MPAAAATARRWRWRRWKWRPRDAVLALLVASVLAPLALYSGAPISPLSGPILTGRSAFGRDPSNSITRNEMGKRLNVLAQENAADRSSEQLTGAASEGLNAKANRSNTSHHTSSPDNTIRVIKDQLRRAKTYILLLPSRGNHGFVRDLRRKMRDIQQALSDATRHRRLPNNVHGKIRVMELMLTKIKQVHENCVSVIDKLLATLHSTEDQVQTLKQRADYLAQVAAKALPKRLHCLALRLTNEYYLSSSYNQNFPYEEKFEDPKLQHYALFSDNVLAAAVVVNSTLVNAKKPTNHVFHIVTDKVNYAAMRMWFLRNPLGKAAVQVQNIEEFTWLNSSYSPVLKQLESHFMINYYFKTGQDKPDKNPKFQNPKYLSILNHLRFYLPEIFPKLSKVLFLDDDTVVQQDLSSLWSIDLRGKVNGAVQTCGETFHRFDRYLNFSNPLIAKKFDQRACGWAYGMNMFDLSEWRKQNITDVYHYWQKLNANRQLWRLGTLPAGLVTFWNHTFPLDRSWHLLGLGYKPNVNQRDMEGAAVIHYNGNLKPWLEIGLPKYRKYWSKYANFDNVFLRECNINP